MYMYSHYRVYFVILVILAGAVQAVPLAPDDESIKDNLCIWLRSPEANFDPSTGTWSDVSGKGNNAVNVGEVEAFNVRSEELVDDGKAELRVLK